MPRPVYARVMQCVAALCCSSLLQCVTVDNGVCSLWKGGVCRNTLRPEHAGVLQCVVLQCVALCCSVLQCVAVYCSVLQYISLRCSE